MLGISYFDGRIVDENRTAVFFEHAAQDLHQGRFARAVRAHEDMDLALVQIKVDVIKSQYAGEPFYDSLHFEYNPAAIRFPVHIPNNSLQIKKLLVSTNIPRIIVTRKNSGVKYFRKNVI